MAVPKRKVSKAKRDSRRANTWKAHVPGMAECPQCHELKLSHRVCKNCGYYDGKKIIEVEKSAQEAKAAAEEEKKASKAAAKDAKTIEKETKKAAKKTKAAAEVVEEKAEKVEEVVEEKAEQAEEIVEEKTVYTVNAVATFYETMVGGVADAGLPADSSKK